MSTPEFTHRSIVECADAIARCDLDAGALTRATLSRIAAQDEALGAYLLVDVDGACAQADAIDAARATGAPLGPLAGVPISVKDMIGTRGLATTAASRMLGGYVPPYDATVVERLRAAGAVILGKVNQDEFAMGSSTESSSVRPTCNPWDSTRVPGGSSGGSAASVAAALAHGSLGTDTGGSIRQPASLCGIVGLKPTYGRVSRYGVVAFASSLDQVGPLARTTRDAARMLRVIAGPDPKDSTSQSAPVPDYEAACTLGESADLRGLRVGVPTEALAGDGCDDTVSAAFAQALSTMEALGAAIIPIDTPTFRHGVAIYYLIATAEASANLARFDGVRFGRRATLGPGDGLTELYARSRGEGFGPEVKRRIMLGTYALSAGYYDAYYLKALKARRLIREEYDRVLAACDVVATPTSPVVAWKLGEMIDDPLAMYLMDLFTIPANLAGLPGLSVPAAVPGGAMPAGLQFVGRSLDEETLFRVASAYTSATGSAGRVAPDVAEARS